MKMPIHAGEPKDMFANNEPVARLDWIDALRGLAILSVIAVHSAYGFPAVGRAFIKFASTGRFGVDLFFVISGFVLYHVYRRLATRSERPRRIFLFRRWARLAPVYYLGVLAYGCLHLPPHSDPANARDVSLNLLFLNGWIPLLARSVVPGGWSISAEAAFALLFVAIVPLLSSSRRTFLACVLAWIVTSQTLFLVRMGLVAALGGKAAAGDIEYLPWTYMPKFMAGGWCWHVWNARQASGRAQRPAVRGLCMFVALGLLVGLSFGLWRWGDRTLLAGGACALFFHAWSAGPLPQGLVSPLAYLGRLSYGLYLIHFCTLEFAQMLVVGLMPAATAPLVLFVGTFLLTLAASLPLASLSWKYLEHPVQVWAGEIGLRGSTPRREAPSISML
jgi:peptidoglycan/LPS O-acetylase OafA/YrhL